VAHERAWFEMREYRRRRLDSAVWIPLRAVEKTLRGILRRRNAGSATGQAR
jgi:hypothetical protein